MTDRELEMNRSWLNVWLVILVRPFDEQFRAKIIQNNQLQKLDN